MRKLHAVFITLALLCATRVSAQVVSIGQIGPSTLVSTTIPVSGTLTTLPPSNASTNLAQIAGTTTSVNSGTKDAGTLRVVLATDQPALTNKLLVTPDSVALPANQSVNVSQVAGTTTDTNSGNKSAGTIRMVLATDQPALTNKLLVTPDLPALAATSTKQSDGTQKTQIVDGLGNVIASTSNNLNVQCANCSGSGASAVDAAAFTASTSVFAPSGGFFQTTATNNALTTGQQGMFQATANRALFVNFRNASGTEIGTSSTPVQVSLANTGSNATAIHSICDSGCAGSGGTSIADEAAFTQGTTNITPIGGIFKTVYTSLTTGQAGVLNLTAKGAAKVAIFDTSDNAITASVDATTNTTTQTTGPQIFGNGSTATPSAVGADGRSVAVWTDLNGRVHGILADGDAFVRQTTAANLNVRQDTSGATGAAPPARADYVGGLGAGATGGFVIGVPVCDSVKAVSMTSATTTLMVTGVSGRHVRICSVSLVTAIANNVAIVSGTGATCGTATAGIAGGSTAANGYNFAANGGITLGSGLGTVMQTAATGDSVCIITSAAGPLAGTIAYTIY